MVRLLPVTIPEKNVFLDHLTDNNCVKFSA